MPNQDDERPSKRRRHDSLSKSPPTEVDKPGLHSSSQSRDKPATDESQRLRGSRDRYHSSERERHTRSQSPTRHREGKPHDRDNFRRRHRSRDRPYEEDNDRYRRRYHSDRASPTQDRYHTNRRADRDREHRDRERSPARRREKDRRHQHASRSPKPLARSKAPLPSQNEAFAVTSNPESALDKPVEKQKPNFGLTGKLAAASNTVQTANQTIILKYHEPAEARKPPARDQWRLYIFKDEEILDTVELSEQSCWLIGREVAIADLPIEHTSCSKQHAVIQFRYLEKRNEFGDKVGKVKPYVLDLESANGTSLNEEAVPAAKYVELRDKDVLRFGHSTREYVIQLPPAT